MPYSKEERKEYDKRYRELNREKKKEYNKKYAEEHKEKKAEYDKKWYQKNKEKKAEYYQLNNEKIRERKREYAKAHRDERRAHCREYLGGKCVKCGTTHNLQFDHIKREGKKYTIAGRIHQNFTILKEELDKCQLLCAPCHLDKTAKEWTILRGDG